MCYKVSVRGDCVRIYSSYMGQAWLLSKDGVAISVLHHPSEKFEFDSILDIIKKYGSHAARNLVDEFMCDPTDNKKQSLLDYYNNSWCKIRTWGTFQEEVTFRITSNGFNWYHAILDFFARSSTISEL